MARPTAPNILVFMTDDHGRWASGCYGSRVIHSPTLDYLAARGARMDRAFTPSPVCSPARASFWTGKLPSGHGIHDYIQEPGRSAHPGLAGQATLADHLHAAGYHTGLCGKWHCQHFWTRPPGFDVWFTNAAGTNARFGPQPFIEGDGQRVECHGHQAPCITDRAVRFLRERPADRPFFLFVGYTDTHTPHSGSPERLVARHRAHAFEEVPVEPAPPARGVVRLAMPADPAQRHESLAQYAAAVEMIDEQVGRVLDELDSLGLLQDTLVVYTSDHGHMNGHGGLHTKGNATLPQNLVDGSVLVPLLVSWPGQIAAGQVRTELVDHCDLFATLLDAAGAGAVHESDGVALPGRSYLPLLQGQAVTWRDTQFSEYGNARMARTADAKLVVRYPGPAGVFADEFYDLGADPAERENRIADPRYAAVVAELRRRVEAHFARHEDPARSGRHIDRQPRCNDWEPWVLTPAELARRQAASR